MKHLVFLNFRAPVFSMAGKYTVEDAGGSYNVPDQTSAPMCGRCGVWEILKYNCSEMRFQANHDDIKSLVTRLTCYTSFNTATAIIIGKN
jgi:ribosomal protein S27AE